MNLDEIKEILYDKATSAAYKRLQELEGISEESDVLYSFFDEFVPMLKHEKYAVRVRAVRLICKQARWDSENKINAAIDDILLSLDDEKPTAVAQTLQFFGHSLLPYKKELGGRIKEALLAMDCSRFNAETMRPLIEKEISKLIKQIGEAQQ